MATIYRSRRGLSFDPSGVFVPIYEVNEKNHAASCLAQPKEDDEGLGTFQDLRLGFPKCPGFGDHSRLLFELFVRGWICAMALFGVQ